MKILQLIQKPQLRGAEIFACQLSGYLQQRGNECVIVTLFKGEATLPFEGKIIHMGLSKGNRFFDWAGWRRLAKIVREERPDVIQANAGDTLKYAVLSKIFFGWKVPLIFRNASTVSLYIKNPLVKRWNAFLYGFTAYIISVSEFTKKDFVTIFPTAAGKIDVIPIGIEPRESKTEKKMAQGQQIVLHVGGFTFEKNHVGLIRIAKDVIKTNPNVIFWLVGDGPLKSEVEGWVRKLNLLDKIKFWSYQPNPEDFFQQADVFILPSIIEGLPAVILEAFYHKLPVITYQVGATSELVKNTLTGSLIEKGDENKFATSILEILEKPQDTVQLNNAYNLVVENYTLEHVSHLFEIAYAKLLKHKNA